MKQRCFLFAISLLASAFLAGCGAGPQEIDKDFVQKSTDKAKSMRSIFDAAGGDWEKADKAKLKEMYGSEENAKKVWDLMKNPPMGNGATGNGTAPMPGAK